MNLRELVNPVKRESETELAERVRPVKSRPGQTADVVAETDAAVTA